MHWQAELPPILTIGLTGSEQQERTKISRVMALCVRFSSFSRIPRTGGEVE